MQALRRQRDHQRWPLGEGQGHDAEVRRPARTQKFVLWHPTDPESAREWDLGNPLSYNDEVGGRFGDMRFGHGEGLNGACVKRFKLFKTKAYLRSDAQAELHCVMVFGIMHGLTHRRRDSKPPGSSATSPASASPRRRRTTFQRSQPQPDAREVGRPRRLPAYASRLVEEVARRRVARTSGSSAVQDVRQHPRGDVLSHVQEPVAEPDEPALLLLVGLVLDALTQFDDEPLNSGFAGS